MVQFPIRQLVERSVDKLKRDAARAMRMPDFVNNAPPLTLYSFNSDLPPAEKADFVVTGSDIDIGGYTTNSAIAIPKQAESSSSVHSSTADADVKAGPSSEQSHLAFHGNMSLRIPQEYAGRIRTGYAGFRNRKRMTLFGEDTWDVSQHTHLKIVAAYRGWEGWRNRWYCNVQTDGPILTDLWQHRLELPPSAASTTAPHPFTLETGPRPRFSTIYIPLSSFVLTNSGHTSEQQMEMLYTRVRTIGFSLLGGGRGENAVQMPTKTYTDAQVNEMRRRAQAGFGKGGGKEDPDPIVEEMLRQDGIVLDKSKTNTSRATGYHRAETTSEASPVSPSTMPPTGASTSPVGLRSAEKGSVQVTAFSEGYYELCIKSVEAVNYDPMDEDEWD